jgi:hypothetical protein
MVKSQQPVMRITPMLLPHQSCAGAATRWLLLHVQRFLGDMRHFQLPPRLDCTMEVDIVIATYGSVLFGVGYHSWLIATTDEEICMAAQDQMASYRSELGGIAAGLGSFGR